MKTHLDLFSGIGGFALAARWCGLETIGFAETNPYASAVLRKHWPDVPNYGDVRNVPKVDCDIITGGFPCQPVSLAGQRRGTADDRWLWPEMLRVIALVRPAWVLCENVPGIITMGIDDVLADMESAGYSCWPLVIPAVAVDARHRRDRVWIVAHTGCVKCRTDEVTGVCVEQRKDGERQASSQAGRTSQAVANSNVTGLEEWQEQPAREEQSAVERSCVWSKEGVWQPEPNVGRVANGIPNRMDRLKCLGNAIVPQVAAKLIQMMIDVDTNACNY